MFDNMAGITTVTNIHGYSGPEINAPGALFVASATVNLYVFAVLVVSHMMKCCPRVLPEKSGSCRLDELMRQSPLRLPALFIDYVLTLLLVTGSIYCLVSTSILSHPFLNEALPPSQSDLIIALLAVNTGRYAFKLGFQLQTSGNSPKTRALVWVDVMHHGFTVICFLVMIEQFQNWMSGLVFILMDSDLLVFDVTRIMKIFGCSRKRKSYTYLTLAGLILGVMTRVIVPLALLTLACTNESPVRMTPVSLAILFSAAMFLGIINVWFIMASVNSYRKCLRAQRNAQALTSLNSLKNALDNSDAKICLPMGIQDMEFGKVFPTHISVIKNDLGVKSNELNHQQRLMNAPNSFTNPHVSYTVESKKSNNELKTSCPSKLYTIPEDCTSRSSSG